MLGGHAPCADLYIGGYGGWALYAAGAGGYEPRASLYARGRAGCALFAGGAGGVGGAGGDGGDTLCAYLYVEAVEGRLCFLEVLDALDAMDTRGDELCATLYTRGCGRWALFAGGVSRCGRG